MLIGATLTVPPTAPVVTLAEAKEHLRVLHDDDDLLIQSYIDAAVAYLDGMDGVLGRALAPQEWRFVFDAVPVRMPLEPVVSSSVETADGMTTATVTVGYPDGVPASIKSAILLHVGSLYATREQAAEKWEPTRAYQALLAPHRRWV